MDNNSRKRPPPLAAIYTLRRSNTLPFCRITGKSHSMDEHHYIPCMDNFPKFDRLSGCRITEKQLCFKDYKYAYPIIDMDGTTRMVTEHDFHCRITSKYRAMAGHKYVYPVLGATTDKKAKDMTSVIEDKSMQDVILPSEVEIIIKGGVEDVLRLHDSEYLFIQSKEGSIIPAALKEIRGKGSNSAAKKGRRHTLPAGLESGIVSDLEEFRRSLGLKMLSEIKQPPIEVDNTSSVNGVDLFDIIKNEVEVLKDVRKSRPKRPGKNIHKHVKKSCNTLEKEKLMTTVEEHITAPPPKMSRLEKYKLQFSAFESHENNESGNRLTLVGAFDENEVVELDFSEPVVHHYESVVSTTYGASTGVVFDVSTSKICSASISNTMNGLDSGDIISETHNTENDVKSNKNICESNLPSECKESNQDRKETETFFKNDLKKCQSVENVNGVVNEENINYKEEKGKSEYNHETDEIIETNGRSMLEKIHTSNLTIHDIIYESNVSTENNESLSTSLESIIPEKIHTTPRTALSKNLMNELKEKLGKKNISEKVVSKNNHTIIKEETISIKENELKTSPNKNMNFMSELQNKLDNKNGNDDVNNAYQNICKIENIVKKENESTAEIFSKRNGVDTEINVSKDSTIIETEADKISCLLEHNGKTKSDCEMKEKSFEVVHKKEFCKIENESQMTEDFLKKDKNNENSTTAYSKLQSSFSENDTLSIRKEKIFVDLSPENTIKSTKENVNSISTSCINKMKIDDENTVLNSSKLNGNDKINSLGLSCINDLEFSKKDMVSSTIDIHEFKASVKVDKDTKIHFETHPQVSEPDILNKVSEQMHKKLIFEMESKNSNFDSQIEFPISHNPFSNTQNAITDKSVYFVELNESQDEQGQITTTSKLESKQLREADVKTCEDSFDTSDERNVQGEKQIALIGANGEEKQWQVCYFFNHFYF